MVAFRGLAASALSAVSSLLGATSRAAEQGATLLRGAPPERPAAPDPMPWDRPAAPDDTATSDDEAAPGPAPAAEEAAEAEEAEEPDPFDDDGHARSPDTHAAALADRAAAEVVAAVDGLSTDELRALYEVESSGRKRKTVLAAIERALTP